MIRQAISCDICGSEKRQTNHWFVATEDGGELRVSGWGSRKRLRPETKHLCGQTCLHKLLDEFVARSIAGQHTHAADASTVKDDASLTAIAPARMPAQRGATGEQSDALAEKTTAIALAKPVIVSPVVLPLPVRTAQPMPPQHAPRYSRAEAWERERERTQGRGDAMRPHKRF